MKGTYFTSNNNEVLDSKLVKPKISPHTTMVEGLKNYENLQEMIKKFSNDACFFQEARQAYLSGKRIFGKRKQDSVETIWNNLKKNLKQVGAELWDLKQNVLGAIANMRQQMEKLEVAKKGHQTAIVVLHNMTIKKCRRKEQQLVGATTPAEKKKLEKISLDLKEMLSMKFFLAKMNQSHSSNVSFFGVTTDFKSRENTFFEKKKLVSEILKNIEANTNGLVLLRKKHEAKKTLWESLKLKIVVAGQNFKTCVINILKKKCIGILQKFGILEKDLPAIRASLVEPLPLQKVHVQEVNFCKENLFGENDMPATTTTTTTTTTKSDKDWVYQESSSSEEEEEEEEEEEKDSGNNNNYDISNGQKTNNYLKQKKYHQHVFSAKRPRKIPISCLPSVKRVKVYTTHETFKELLNVFHETFPVHVDDDDNNKPSNSMNLANVGLDNSFSDLLKSYTKEYPNMSDEKRGQYSDIFATANDIQHFQRRHRLMNHRKNEKKREKEALDSEDEEEEDDNADVAYDSDLSCTSSDEEEQFMNEWEERDSLSNLWGLDSEIRTARMVSVLYDSDEEEKLILPSDIAATIQVTHVPAPFKKKQAFLQWEQGNPNAGQVLNKVVDMVSSSIALPPMIPYNALIFGRFCVICCRVVSLRDPDCICTDYRGLKRSQCKDQQFFATLRMKNSWVVLKRNVRRSRELEHRSAWRRWRHSQRDLLLFGHPVLRVKQGFKTDPRVGNHLRDFMRFVFANYINLGTNDCVVCGDVLDVNRSFNFCNTCKAWKPFQEIWKDVQKEVRPKNKNAVAKQHRLAHKHNRKLKHQAEKRQKKYLNSSSSSNTTSHRKPKTVLSAEAMEKVRLLYRNRSGKQPQQLAFKTPKACHIETYQNKSSNNSDDSDSGDDDADDFDPNNPYAVPSSNYSKLPVNPIDVVRFQTLLPPPPPLIVEIPALPPQINGDAGGGSGIDLTIHFEEDDAAADVDDYVDDAMTMDFN